jgi:hypothetical protein
VLAYLNGTLNKDFQRIQELTAELDRFHQASAAAANDLFGRADHERTEAVALREAQARDLDRLTQVIATAEDKASALDGRIAEAKSSADDLRAVSEIVMADHEARWADTAREAQEQYELLSQRLNDQIAAQEARWAEASREAQRQHEVLTQRLNDQVATSIGEMQGANQAWQTHIEASYQTWRKQVEAAIQAWQLAQAQQASQWRTSFEQEMEGRLDVTAEEARAGIEQVAERLDASAGQVRSAMEQANVNAKTIAQLSQQHSESVQMFQRQIETNRAAWETAIQTQVAQIADMRLKLAFMRKLMYGAGAALVVLAVLCIIALAH